MSELDGKLLTKVVSLEMALRQAESIDELSAIFCEKITDVLPTHRVFFAFIENRKFRVLASSESKVVNEDLPEIIWLQKVMLSLQHKMNDRKAYWVESADVDESLSDEWHKWFKADCAFWCPLFSAEGKVIGGLFLECLDKCSHDQSELIHLLSETCADVLSLLKCKEQSRGVSRSRSFLRKAIPVIFLVFIAMLFMPIQRTAVISAEVVSKNPIIVKSPLTGVIDQVAVMPGEDVKKGQLLFRLDVGELNVLISRYENRLRYLKEKYQKASHFSLTEYAQKQLQAQLTLMRTDIDRLNISLSHARAMVSRAQVNAPIAGMILFVSKESLMGRPVRAGEKVFMIANSKQTELRMWLPVADSLVLKVGDEVKFYPHINPMLMIPASLSYIALRPIDRLGGGREYVLKAEFSSKDKSTRVGESGDAKVFGEKTSIANYLFDKPIKTVRQWLGF